MRQEIFKLLPGLCTCVIGGPDAEPRRFRVLRLSGTEATIERGAGLSLEQLVRATVELADGPSITLSGVVAHATATTIVVEWRHSTPEEAERMSRAIGSFAKRMAARRAAQELPGALERARLAAAGSVASPESVPAIAAAAEPRFGAGHGVETSDVDSSLRSHATAMRAAELAAKVDTVHVLSLSKIKALIRSDVDAAVKSSSSAIGEDERKRLVAQVEESFREQIRTFQEEKAELEEQTKSLDRELAAARALLAEERQRVVRASQFTVSDAGMVEIEDRFAGVIDRAAAAGGLSKRLEEELRGFVLTLLDSEREKIRANAERAQGGTIELLERKVRRLALNLEDAARDRDKARRYAKDLEARGLSLPGGICDVAIADDEAERGRKLELLQQIFIFNQEIRQALAARQVESAAAIGPETPPSDLASDALLEPEVEASTLLEFEAS